MPVYKVFIKPSACKELDAIKIGKDHDRVGARIFALANEPRPVGSQKMTGEEKTYRIREGTYRIIYSIDDAERVVRVLKVGHRKDVYR